MPKVVINATELQETDVKRVSLVKRGANRIPFRIVKEDTEDMLDLGRIGRTLFAKAESPRVAAVLVSKSADLAKIEPIITKAGLVTTQKSETADAIVFAQPGAEMGRRAGVLKLDRNVALVVSGLANVSKQQLRKDFAPWDAEPKTFMEALNTDGFFPGLCMAMDALRDIVSRIMDEADAPEDAANEIEAAIGEFRSYIVDCARAIPVHAFKMDNGYQRAKVEIAKTPGVENASAVGGLGGDPDNTQSLASRQQQTPDQGVSANALLSDAMAASGQSVRTQKAVDPVSNMTGLEISPTNADQGTPRPSGHGGKLPEVAGTGETPQGTDVKPERGPAEEAQGAGRQDTGHGGKNPEITGTGSAAVGTDRTPEPSLVNDSQAGSRPSVSGTGANPGGNISAEVLKSLLDEGFAALRKQFGEQVAGVAGQVSTLSTAVARLDGRVKKAEELAGGTVFVSNGEDAIPVTMRKSAGEPPPLLDTAFFRPN